MQKRRRSSMHSLAFHGSQQCLHQLRPGRKDPAAGPGVRWAVVRGLLEDHHARMQQRLQRLRERAAGLKVAPEVAGSLDHLQHKIDLLPWPSSLEEQPSVSDPAHPTLASDKPHKPQAVRHKSVQRKKKPSNPVLDLALAAPPWLGVAIYAVGALALALSFKSGTKKWTPPPTLHPLVHHHHASPVPGPEQLLGHFRMAEADESQLVSLLADHSVRLRNSAAKAFSLMQEAASRDGVRLVPLSGFRSVREQQALFYDVKAARVQRASERARVSAPPGFSEHHTGYALDIGDHDVPAADVELAFEQTPAFAWLQSNAARFHFEMSFPSHNPRGIAHEPWHWRFVGDDHSLWTFYGRLQQS